MRISPRWRGALLALLFLPVYPVGLSAQERVPALSDAEIEQLREAAPLYPERVQLFSSFLEQRAKEIVNLSSGRRHAGRELDIHDRMEQFTSIADDLLDNLDDYGKRHRDVRKVLPKLLTATDRWRTDLQTPPDNENYNVQRKLALETLKDLQEDTARLIDEQKSWFLAHPPEKPGAGARD